MSSESRKELIQRIEKSRSGKLLTYIQSDVAVRAGPNPVNLFQMSYESPRKMIDHLNSIGATQKIILFMYSRGGDVSVPWVMVNTLRKYCKELEVIIPYRAHSSATMVALGADNIVMGKHAELGPIDPTMTIVEVNPEEPSKGKTTTIAVEDITSFVTLAKEGMGLSDQRELGKAFEQLAEKVGPVALGSINRQQSYIRRVARKLLELRNKSPDPAKMNSIVEGLITGAFFHQHTITREEAAKDFGFDNITIPDEALEELVWKLFLSYEDELRIGSVIKAEELFSPSDQDEKTVEGLVGVSMDSESVNSRFLGDLVITRIRRPLPTVNLNVNLAVPPGQEAQVNPQIVQQIQGLIQRLVQEELRRQSPVSGYSLRWQRDRWEVTRAVRKS